MPEYTQLSKSRALDLIQAPSIDNNSLNEIYAFFQEDAPPEAGHNIPTYQVDPRSGEPVIFNPKRAQRPEGYQTHTTPDKIRPCPICTGQTTRILDLAELSEGFTFINKNLFPMVAPVQSGPNQSGWELPNNTHSLPATGLHFLQWTSSLHDVDWHNLPYEDALIVMQRLAALEKTLLSGDSDQPEGFVSIIKNVGDKIGGSLPHGHQQIIYSSIMPRRVREQILFMEENGEPFSAFMLRHTSENLIIRNYGKAVLLVPYFMRRPFDMMLIVKNTSKSTLHALDQDEIAEVTQGWQDAIPLVRQVLIEMGREIAYNVLVHNGPGAGLYFEFLPYSQEYGGFEQMGLVGCQSEPALAAAQLRRMLTQ